MKDISHQHLWESIEVLAGLYKNQGLRKSIFGMSFTNNGAPFLGTVLYYKSDVWLGNRGLRPTIRYHLPLQQTLIFQQYCLTLYLIETHFNYFANRADPDQAALVRAS